MTDRTVSNALAASAQMAATTAIGLVYFGFLMRALGPEALGGWLAWLSLGMIACLADLGLRDALVRRIAVAVAADDRPKAAALLDTTVITVAVSMALALGLLMGVLPRFFDFGAAARRADASMIASVALLVWLQRVADTYAAALEGLQRYPTVARNNVLGALAGLVAVVLLVPRLGVHAASAGLTVQYGLGGLAHAIALRRWNPERGWLPGRWSWTLTRQSLGYGMSVQGAVATFIIIESAVKLALSRADALALLSFFDLAFRIGRGLRNLITAGNRVLVPRLAQAQALAENSDDAAASTVAAREVESVYLRSFQVILFIALPIFTLCAASAGLISLLTRGVVDSTLVLAFLLTLPAWYAFALADPAINLQMATGSLKPMLRAHAAMLVLLALGGLVLEFVPPAALPGSRGLATIAWASLSIILPCLWMVRVHHRARALPLGSLAPGRALLATGLGALAAVLSTRFATGFVGQASGVLLAAAVLLLALRFLPAWPWAMTAVTRLWRKRGPTGSRE
ncbi:MAG: hypothetical protein ABI699_00895 [Caldimonas sp.]